MTGRARAAGSDFNHDDYASFTSEAIRSESFYYNCVKANKKLADGKGISVFHKHEGGAIFRA